MNNKNIFNQDKCDDKEKYSISGVQNPTSWDKNLAKEWHGFTPPSRPSSSELKIYQKYFDEVKYKKTGPNPSVLILGTTNEFRKLALDSGFSTTIVDYSIDYYNEISVELPAKYSHEICEKIKNNEELINCSWEKMEKELKGRHFDIIIGDLAIGNVSPENLDKVLKNIYNLLFDGGLFLGKTFLSFKDKEVSKDDLEKLFKQYFNQNIETKEESYALTIYELSLYACDLKKSKKINFFEISKIVKNIIEKQEMSKAGNFLKELYLGKDAFFKEQLIEFYIYSCKEYSEKLQDLFKIKDSVFGIEFYSKYFPLIVCQKPFSAELKDKNLEQIRRKTFRGVDNYITDDRRKYDEWGKALSAQQFLFGLREIYPDAASIKSWKNVQDLISQKVQQSLYFKIDEKLNFVLENYADEKMEKEAKEKAILNKDFQINNIVNNYALGVLCYIISFLTAPSKNDAFVIVKKKLFENIKDNKHGWEPENSPWITARICISLRKTWCLLNKSEKNKLISIVKYLGEKFNWENKVWACDVSGSVIDTTSLCIEALMDYYDVIKEDQQEIKSVLDEVLNHYVLDGQIYETMIIFPLYEEVASEIGDTQKGKRTIDNVEFYTILLRVLNRFYPKSYLKEKEIITQIISDFWILFEGYLKNDKLKTGEISAIPQILYCCAKAMENKKILARSN